MKSYPSDRWTYICMCHVVVYIKKYVSLVSVHLSSAYTNVMLRISSQNNNLWNNVSSVTPFREKDATFYMCTTKK